MHNSYGEKGCAILFDVIAREFRGTESFWGIPTLKFIQRVLIPEAALGLIQLDLGLSNSSAGRRRARKIKDASTEYGNMQYKLD